MDRGDYYEAKAALQNVQIVLAQNEARAQRAHAVAAAVFARLNLPPAAGYRWNDETLTIEPVEAA